MSEGTTTGKHAYSGIAKSYSSSPVQPAVVASAQSLLASANDVGPFSSASHILDLGCGPGTLTSELLDTFKDLPPGLRITALDSSAQMIDQISATRSEQTEQDPKSLWSNVETVICDAHDLSSIADDEMSHVLAGLVLFLLPDSLRALKECFRVLKPGGILAFSCWPRSDWQSLMQLVPVVRPDKLQYNVPPGWRDEPSITRMMGDVSFRNVRFSTVEVHTSYDNPRLFCQWLVKMMPGLRAAIADFSQSDEQLLEQVMVDWLVNKNGPQYGVLKGECIICVGEK